MQSTISGLNFVSSGRYSIRQGLSYTLAGKDREGGGGSFLEVHIFSRAEVVFRGGLAASRAATDSL